MPKQSSDARKTLKELVDEIKSVFRKHSRSARDRAWDALTSAPGRKEIRQLIVNPNRPVTGTARWLSFRDWVEIHESTEQILFYKRDADQYGFMSNFHQAPFELDGKVWPTVEHYYMAMKSHDEDYQDKIMSAHSPGKAKRLGDSRMDDPRQAKQSLFRRGSNLREDWNDSKVDVMRRAVYAKFSQNPQLRQALLETGDAELIEDSPSDTFWGSGANGTGQNWLGKILMEVRAKLQG